MSFVCNEVCVTKVVLERWSGLHWNHISGVIGLNPTVVWGLCVWSLHVLSVPLWVSYWYYSIFPQSKDIHVKLLTDSKLAIGVKSCGGGGITEQSAV